MSMHTAPKTTYLKDYTVPDFLIETVDLTFELGEDVTKVCSRLLITQNPAKKAPPRALVLNGEQLELVSIKLDEQELMPPDYQLDSEYLTIPNVPTRFALEVVTHIKPKENTALSGLYVSRGIFCTQCEAEGFRRITYFLDRPDVLASYTTTIIADKDRYPVLLSNGNPIKRGELTDNRHWITWQDPFKKPCYLFALVAGNLECLEDEFNTHTGRKVMLRIFSEQGQRDKCLHAMECLKKAMRWDEEAYGCEYDLDIFMIAVINDFNMGAMENKGLNIFNSKYILANPQTATDTDYENILSVVGHEYFHNWTGDRVTCRDWFQLSLKEGLTVFREQQFTAKMLSPLVTRIQEVKRLRQAQFTEDAGPLAHPVQPDSYIEINNFYTMTIYEKGAEVIRMMKKLLGADHFLQGMDLYFSRFDGQAATIHDFVKAMEDASGHDLTQFKLWYHQAGTPELRVTSDYDAAAKTYTLTVEQHCPPTPGQPEKKPLLFPFKMGLLGRSGKEILLQLEGENPSRAKVYRILHLKNKVEVLKFVNVQEKPVPSMLRKLSAPMILKYDYTDEELCFLLKHDTDGYNRWDAGQQLAYRFILKLIENPNTDIKMIVDVYRDILEHDHHDKSFIAELLTLPSEVYIGEQMPVIDVDGIYKARLFLRKQLAQQLQQQFLAHYHDHAFVRPYSNDRESIGRRRLQNVCLSYLMLLGDAEILKHCMRQFENADNMTDVLGALNTLVDIDCAERKYALDEFYRKWQHDSLVMDKWLAIQARSELPDNLSRVKALMQNPAFDIKNPNKIRSLIGVFCHDNIVQFHDKSGAGYEFLTEQVLKLDPLNPQVAARLLEPMTHWQRYDAARQQLMRNCLERIVKTEGLSKDTYEIAAKSLGG